MSIQVIFSGVVLCDLMQKSVDISIRNDSMFAPCMKFCGCIDLIVDTFQNEIHIYIRLTIIDRILDFNSSFFEVEKHFLKTIKIISQSDKVLPGDTQRG